MTETKTNMFNITNDKTLTNLVNINKNNQDELTKIKTASELLRQNITKITDDANRHVANLNQLMTDYTKIAEIYSHIIRHLSSFFQTEKKQYAPY